MSYKSKWLTALLCVVALIGGDFVYILAQPSLFRDIRAEARLEFGDSPDGALFRAQQSTVYPELDAAAVSRIINYYFPKGMERAQVRARLKKYGCSARFSPAQNGNVVTVDAYCTTFNTSITGIGISVDLTLEDGLVTESNGASFLIPIWS